MQRFLMYVSYIGTQFRFRSGVQKTITLNEPYKADPTTIQGVLEIALGKLTPVNRLHVIPSSRTDTGVHALNSTFHVDLLRPSGKLYEPHVITSVVNKYFSKEELNVRILKTLQVPCNFHCRYHAKSRTYLYRLAILQGEYIKNNCNVHMHHIPIEEYGRCHFLCFPNFDLEKMLDASKLFLGYHDFRTFMGRSTRQPNKMTRRNIRKLDITKGMSSAFLENDFLCNKSEKYDYWNIIFNSEGFLYNQVRRIVGTLIAVGKGKVTPDEVKCMLQIPSHLSWNPRIIPAPSHGLYLCEVEYSSHDLEHQL